MAMAAHCARWRTASSTSHAPCSRPGPCSILHWWPKLPIEKRWGSPPAPRDRYDPRPSSGPQAPAPATRAAPTLRPARADAPRRSRRTCAARARGRPRHGPGAAHKPDHDHETGREIVMADEMAMRQKQARAEQDHEGQPTREMIHLRDKRRRQRFDAGDQPADAADLGRATRRHDQSARRPPGDERSGPQHRAPVAEGRSRGDRFG